MLPVPKQDWKAYFPEDGETLEDAEIIMSVRNADQAAEEAVEYDWSSRDGWERGDSAQNGFTVIVVSPDGEEFHYTGFHEPDVRHIARRKKD